MTFFQKIQIFHKPVFLKLLREKKDYCDTALRLASYLGTTAKFWVGLQNDYDLEEERIMKEDVLIKIKKNAPHNIL